MEGSSCRGHTASYVPLLPFGVPCSRSNKTSKELRAKHLLDARYIVQYLSTVFALISLRSTSFFLPFTPSFSFFFGFRSPAQVHCLGPGSESGVWGWTVDGRPSGCVCLFVALALGISVVCNRVVGACVANLMWVFPCPCHARSRGCTGARVCRG
eukprot:scaffold79771_cov28-Tisochrysis_lutea.AAC.1